MTQDAQGKPLVAAEAEYELPSVFALGDGPLPSSGHWCVPGTPYTLWWPGFSRGESHQILFECRYDGVLLNAGNTKGDIMEELLPRGLARAGVQASTLRATGAYLVRLHHRVERVGGWDYVEAAYRLGGIAAVSPMLGGVGCVGA